MDAHPADRRLRPLRPLATSTDDAPEGSPSPGLSPSPSSHILASSAAPLPSRTRRAPVSAACESCRRRKSKCDGNRPKCQLCHTRGFECEYVTEPTETRGGALKRRHRDVEAELQEARAAHATLQSLFDKMQTSDEASALAIFRSLRQGVNPTITLQELTGGHLGTGDSSEHDSRDDDAEMTQSDNSRSPKWAGHDNLSRYTKSLGAVDAPSPERPSRGNPYLHSPIYNTPSSVVNPTYASAPDPSALRIETQYDQSFEDASVVDARLDSVRPSLWTTVSTDDNRMRELLRHYLLHDYHWFSCFHKDLFLDDMLSQCDHFCSSLLVNVILAHACSSHDPANNRLDNQDDLLKPDALGIKFFAEARRLWAFDHSNAPGGSITTVQAAMIMSLIFSLHAMNEAGTEYKNLAVSMGHSIGLFAVSPESRSSRDRHGYDFTAWCLYSYLGLQRCQVTRLALIEHPPILPLPDPDVNPEWYGEFILQYAPDGGRAVETHPSFFRSKCQMMLAVTTAAAELSAERSSASARKDSSSKTPQRDLPRYIHHLEAWFASLPASLSPASIVFPFQLKLHLCYHNVLGRLYELLAATYGVAATEMAVRIQARIAGSKMSFDIITKMYNLRHQQDNCGDAHLAHAAAILAYV